MEFINTCLVYQKFREDRANCRPKDWVVFGGKILSLLKQITLLWLYIAKLEQLDCKKLFVGALANSCYSTLWLWIVKNVVVKKTIYVSFVPKLSWYFFVKWIKMHKLAICFLTDIKYFQSVEIAKWFHPRGCSKKQCRFRISTLVMLLTNQI